MSERLLDDVFAAMDSGRLDRAKAMLTHALRREPDHGPFNSAMGVVLATEGRLEQAVFYATRSTQLMPDLPESWLNLGQMLGGLGRFEEGIRAIERGLSLDPAHVEGIRRYATVLAGAHRYADAMRACARGLALAPDDHNLLLEQGRIEMLIGHASRAAEIFEQAARKHPDSMSLASSLVFAMMYEPGSSRELLFERSRRCGRLTASLFTPLPARSSPIGHPLRVGFISPDFRNHAVARFIEPLLAHLPRERLQAYGYATSIHADGFTKRLRSHCAEFRVVSGTLWQNAALRVRDARVDVLIDLAGYTADSGIDVLAMRPAPIQGSYLGYPGTTGMPGVDFRIVDSHTDPAGEPIRADDYATEALIRLDPCFLCYRPDEDAPAVNVRDPSAAIAFGCFGSGPKISDPLLRAWASLLERVPGSRLVLKNHALQQSELRAALMERAARAGLDPARMDLMEPTSSSREHLAAYAKVDIALDTFPYTGTTTTCEALHMGVPVVSLVGRAHHERVGLSLLSAVGHPEWCASDVDSYIAIAAGLAGDRARLANLRATLRETLAKSVLCDGPGFAARFAAAIESFVASRKATP